MAQAHRIKSKPPVTQVSVFRFLPWLLRELGFWTLAGVALGMAAALFTYSPADPAWTHTATVARLHNLGGVVGAWFADVTLYFFGYAAYLLPLGVAFAGWRLCKRGALLELDGEIVLLRMLGFLVSLGTVCGLVALHFASMPGLLPGSGSPGGLVGLHVSQFLFQAFQILPDRGFADLECHRQLAHPCAAFLLNPVKNLAPAWFGQETRHRVLARGVGFRFQQGSSPK